MKPQLHVSHLNMLAKCGIQFQRRYGKTFGVGPVNEIIAPATALAIGSSVHDSVELNLTRKMEGEETSLDHVQAVARDSFFECWEDGILLSVDESANTDKAKGSAVDLSVALAGLHFAEVAPGIQPIAVEKPFVIKLPDLPVDLAGRIDIVEANDELRDTKTIAKTPSANENISFQNRMYSQAHFLETGRLPTKFSNDYLVKTKTPKAVTLTLIPTEEFIKPLIARIERAVEIIESVKAGRQAFAPAQEDSWVCSAKYCGYAKTCKFWSGR